jgi:hypothetical protein
LIVTNYRKCIWLTYIMEVNLDQIRLNHVDVEKEN